MSMGPPYKYLHNKKNKGRWDSNPRDLLKSVRLVNESFHSLTHTPINLQVFRDFIAQFVLLSTVPQRGTLSFGLARFFSNQMCQRSRSFALHLR